MVLQRHPKKYKHMVRTMLTQLVLHQNITTTRAKAKHLRPIAQKLMIFAKKAYNKQTSPLNLLKGRVHTQKAYTKLLVDIMPRLKNVRCNYVQTRYLQERRKGDNAPMAQIYIKGNQKTEFEKKRLQQALRKKQIPNIKQYKAKILSQQKQFIQKKLAENPNQADFWKQKLEKSEFSQWVLTKQKKQPPKYTLLI